MTTATSTQLWIYPIGDDSPGSYKNVDGYALSDEGSGKVSSIEEFRLAAEDMRENCGFDCQFALVEETLDEDGEGVEWSVLEVA